MQWMKSSRKFLALAAALIVVLAFTVGCSSKSAPPAAAPEAPKVEIKEVVIGAAYPLTGKESKIGASFKMSTELAFKEVMDAGGLNIGGKKVPVRLVLLDDTTDPTKSAQLVEQLITQEKVHAILGGYSTLLVQAQSVVPERYGIPYVNGGGASTSTYGRSKWVFGTLSSIDTLALTQMEYLKSLIDAGKLSKPLKIATIWENTEHGKDYQKGITEFAKKFPDLFQVVFNEGFELYASSYKPLLTKVQNAKADIFMADARIEDYITIHREYTQMGMYHKMVTYGPRGTDKAARDALGAATDYVFASNWWSASLPAPQSKAYVEKYKAFSKIEAPAWYDALPYETARILFKAIEAAGSVDPEKIRDALTKVELKDSLVPGGVLKFSSTGQAIYPFVVSQGKPGGKTDLVWPKDGAAESVAPIPKK